MAGKVPVTAPIDTAGVNDTYPTHYANKGFGGFKNVISSAVRNLISSLRINDGTTVYVKEITDNNPHGYISIYQDGTSSWIDYPLRKIDFIDSPNSTHFNPGKKGDQIITNDYVYICTESASNENQNIAIWKKLILIT